MFRLCGLGLPAGSAVIFFSGPVLGQSGELDFKKMQRTFSEDFDDTLSVSPWGPNTRWIAHTPWAGDFGDARFADPMLGVFPFTVKDGILRIGARKCADGKREPGLLASASNTGRD